MSEFPSSLRALPPEALAIIEYFQASGGDSALSNAIMDGTGLNERVFWRGIRRLVTKNLLTMDGNNRYRLTEAGQQAVEEYVETDGDEWLDDESDTARTAERRLVVVLPTPLVSGQPATVSVRLEGETSENPLESAPNLLVRLNTLHADPSAPQEKSLTADEGGWLPFEITPGAFSQLRVRVQVYQLEGEHDAIPLGGLYVDAPIAPPGTADEPTYAAYGSTVQLTVET